ncbi:MAG TPA: iron export ABC transporter permease subunit FetB [Deltaproteobacteria bacterium]|nr:iron export ABC transporter permease subunit FetB [Deltaproteobacteria bacterium]HCP45045.1 iron export ABC transporter permease subunit FetB [Deltaproteobacteria bacterium]
MNAGPIPLSALDLVLAAGLVVINGLLSLWLGLGLERKLFVASVRTVVQLLLLGWILMPVFTWNNQAVVFGICLAMVILATRAAVKRSSRSYRGAYRSSFVALLLGAGATALIGTWGIVGVEPWWQPRYLIPLLGMILGNGLTGISLGLDRCLTQLDEGRARVDVYLALGASRWEAARPVAADAMRSGMIPILNAMTVVGLVTIPGMMTGQILGGTDPAEAARYQILIMFLIASATAMGTALSVLLSLRALFDDDHRLRSERIEHSPS